MNIFFYIKRLSILVIKLAVLPFSHQNPFTEDQPVLSQPSQVIFVPIAPCDNVESNSNNDHELDIEVSKEICSYSGQNLNEAHETIQSIQMSTQTKRLPEYLKDYHCNLNVSNTSSKVKYPLNSLLSYNKLSPSYTSFVMFISSHVEPNTYSEGMKHDYWREAIQCEIKHGRLLFCLRTKLPYVANGYSN